MQTTTSELVGMAIVAICILVLTAQTFYAIGAQIAQKRERASANQRVRGVIDYENRRKPKTRKNRLKAARKSRIGTISIPSLEVRV